MVRLLFAAVASAALFVPSAVAAQGPPAPAGSPAPPVGASPSPAASPAAEPSADPAVTVRAKEWLHRVQTATLDRSQLSAEMNAALTDALETRVAAQFGALGNPSDFVLVDRKSVAGSTAYVYRATFASGPLYWVFAVDPSGKISGMRFLPAQ